MYRVLTIQQVKKLSQAIACLVLTVLVSNPATAQQLPANNTNAQGVNSEIKIQRQRRGIDAELVDQGDYYMHPDGRQIRMLRKKDVYVIESDNTERSMQRAKGQFGDRIQDVTSHRLGGNKVVRIDNGEAVKRRRNETFDISAGMVESADNAIRNLKPVFANEQGDGDILLMPKLTVKLADGVDPTAALNRLDRRYGLSLDRKLRVSGNVYSLSLKTQRSESQQFALVRSVMNDAMVEWAEPQFYVKALKEQYTPNDALIGDQWNLIDEGFRGSRCDTDCDANNAWDIDNANGTGAVTGSGIVIAVIDDGVQLDHPDLKNNIWVNDDELTGLPGVDDDLNGYVDDINGYDFVTDEDSSTVCVNLEVLSDGDVGPLGDDGQDANPSPRATANCVVANELFEEDDHGTAVAGILAAEGNNSIGIAGVAYNAEIMAIRLISDFDSAPLIDNDESFCVTAAEAMEYAAQHADVINNSWSLPIECSVLDEALERVTSGMVTIGLGSKRNGTVTGAGSPVIFSSGNDASGWVKVTVPVSAGAHAYEWRLLRSAFPESGFSGTVEDDTVWLDDIIWPDGGSESFESGIGDFTSNWVINNCDAICADEGNLGAEPEWGIENSTDFVRSGSQSARVVASASDCGNSYLHQIKEGPAGEISFWVWVSTDTTVGGDRFEFLIDGEEVLSYGDQPTFGFVFNEVAYPASSGNRALLPTGLIAVGASTSGDLSQGGSSLALLSAEERVSYSQYGPMLDLVAPSSDQHLEITTTDRTSSDGYSGGDYTPNFGGTSASAPVVSGVAAAMLAINPNLSAAQVKTMLRDSADKIGLVDYVGGRNDFHGFGRVNMYRALLLANGDSLSSQNPQCSNISLDYNPASDLLLPRYQPQPTDFCPAIGEVPVTEDDEFCFPIVASNGNVAVICL